MLSALWEQRGHQFPCEPTKPSLVGPAASVNADSHSQVLSWWIQDATGRGDASARIIAPADPSGCSMVPARW